MITLHKKFCILLLVFTVFTCSSNFHLVAESKFLEFDVNLIHRDSPRSPFYNPSLTHPERVTNALRRSIKRSRYLKEDHSVIIPNHGEFLVRIFVGTPPTETDAIIDTGSDLSWIQCKPCTNCFFQKTPTFDPNKSSTYKSVPCNSTICTSLQESSCDNSTDFCKYSTAYTDSATFSMGNIFTDELKFDGSVIFHQIALGCGHDNGLGAFDDNGSGMIGFGGGPNSFITQVNQSINGKFSYCLVPFQSKNVGKLHFGENEVFSSNDVVISTPLVKTKDLSTFYYITLTSLTVKNESIIVANNSSQGDGNMLIDSGTTLTNLPSDIYNRFESLVKKYVKLLPVDDPQGILSLCYNITNFDYFPDIVFGFHATEGFKGDLRLRPANTFVQTSDNTMCLAFSPVEIGQPAVLGNLAQMNMFVGFDLVKKTVSFEHTHCGRK